eukprot:CAMPEP_0177601332 /NCGR_PEP_ID=MMETSP0419_2-20121207/14190_1 /TAXON_ID=582737 /ORGANISM="Tetraselmis sp., Strain GSL018" /LENGTH=465 /DNA_ID=CAMNT_0019094565 /DNA_START=119 /DNA_END=1513 /DNA_ORIENTATION=+
MSEGKPRKHSESEHGSNQQNKSAANSGQIERQKFSSLRVGSVTETTQQWRRKQTGIILQFVLPALSIVLSDPLMTLLDTIFIGQFSSTDDMASLGPNTLVFNSAQWIFNALAVGTTSVIVHDLKQGNAKKASESLSLALSIALVFGFAELIGFRMFSVAIIKATGTPERVVELAAKYMDVRALAAPAVLLTLVCQAAMLAQKDSFTPCKVVLVSFLVKTVADVLLLLCKEFRAVEAAAATVVSQMVGGFLMLHWNNSDPEKVRWTLRLKPTRENLVPFAHCLGPLTGVYVIKNLCYILVNIAATSQVFLAVAAHQAMYSLWVLMAFCAIPLERAAITFIPPARPGDVRALEQLLIAMASVAGVLLGVLVFVISYFAPDLLTQDERVWDLIREIAPHALISILLNALDAAYNGILLARQEYSFLLSAMLLTLLCLYVYNGFIAEMSLGLPGVWGGLVLFVGIRCTA